MTDKENLYGLKLETSWEQDSDPLTLKKKGIALKDLRIKGSTRQFTSEPSQCDENKNQLMKILERYQHINITMFDFSVAPVWFLITSFNYNFTEFRNLSLITWKVSLQFPADISIITMTNPIKTTLIPANYYPSTWLGKEDGWI